jgi:hypothetical protein
MLAISRAELDGGDAPRLVAGKQMRRRAPSRLLLEVDVGERLPVVIADDVAGVGLLGGPGRREAALGHGPLEHARRAVRPAAIGSRPHHPRARLGPKTRSEERKPGFRLE